LLGFAATTVVTELKTELDATEKRLDEIEKSQGGAAAGGGGGGDEPKSKKQAKKDAKKGKGKGGGKEMPPGGWPKKEKAPAGKKLTKPQKAAEKEGGKKGQDLSGMCDIGGMTYFTVVMESCEGSWDLLEMAMAGANKVVDPDGDDRKGGAHELIKCFMDIDDKEEDGVITIKAVAKKNLEHELFPLKQRDAAINVSFQKLKSLQLVASDSSGSEVDMGDLGDAAGFEW
jgi:hypothetical protein